MAVIAQLEARKSHNPKVVSSILCRSLRRPPRATNSVRRRCVASSIAMGDSIETAVLGGPGWPKG